MPDAPRVRDHMTQAPYSIELGSSLAYAANCMHSWGVDRLPVYEGGALCGLLSARDLTLARELGVSQHDVLLKDVPLQDGYIASPDASISRVARAMALQKVGCAVVQEAERVVGMLAWPEVISALVGTDVEREPADEPAAPSDVRRLILMEHANLRRLLHRVERASRRILTTPTPRESELEAAYDAARTLCVVMANELELEDQVLAPTLAALDAWGNVRADRLRSQHAEQALVLRSYLRALEHLSGSRRAGSTLAVLMQELVDRLRNELQTEEERLLQPDLLRDDSTAAVVEAG